jgi:hypothetical protein
MEGGKCGGNCGDLGGRRKQEEEQREKKEIRERRGERKERGIRKGRRRGCGGNEEDVGKG